jgi:uncharacterized protein (DUF2336 family)
MATGRSDGEFRPPADAIRAGRKALDISHLCTLAPLPESAIKEIDPALTALLQQAEDAVRLQVARRLADCSWAPREAVRMLAFDELKIASPVLTRSPCLDDSALVEAAGLGRDRRLLIAERPTVSKTVVSAITAYRETECLTALADNAGAELGPASASDFAAAARGDEGLQTRLARRSDLDPAIARAVFAVAAAHVKDMLAAAMPDLDPARVSTAVDEGLEAALDAGEDDAAESLVSSLMARGALSKADVLRAAHGGRADIADHAIARLTGLPSSDWRRALGRSPLRTTILAARTMAMTLDEAAALYAALADAGRAHLLPPDALAQACREIYTGFARDDARRALHRMGAGASIH